MAAELGWRGEAGRHRAGSRTSHFARARHAGHDGLHLLLADLHGEGITPTMLTDLRRQGRDEAYTACCHAAERHARQRCTAVRTKAVRRAAANGAAGVPAAGAAVLWWVAGGGLVGPHKHPCRGGGCGSASGG